MKDVGSAFDFCDQTENGIAAKLRTDVALCTSGGDGLHLAADLPQHMSGSRRCFAACRRI